MLRRRRFLQNAGLLAVAAPFVHRLAGAADTDTSRIVLLFHGNGHRRGQWATRHSDTDFELHRIASALEPFREHTILFDRLNHDAMKRCRFPTTKHGLGSGIAFTGRPVIENGWPEGPSVDQIIAARIGNQTPRRSIQLGSGVHDTNVYGRISFDENGVALTPEQVPAMAYATMFEPLLGGVSDGEAQRRLARKLSVLDLVKDDVCALRSDLGSEDRQRLEAHCEGIREIEQGLSGSFDGSLCEPLSGLVAEQRSPANYEQTLRDHIALTRLAFSCGITRVVSLALGQAHGGMIADAANAQTGETHHHVSHWSSSMGGNDEPYVRISEWYTKMVAELLGALQGVEESSGTLLDNCVLLWGTDVTDGEEHGEDDIPWAVFGGKNLGIAGGRMIDAADRNVNDVLISMCHAMGLRDVETVGDADLCAGPLL